jgi:nucleoside-diphosphate-sugar epimerase
MKLYWPGFCLGICIDLIIIMSAAKNIVITSANGATAGWVIPLLREAGHHTVGLIRRSSLVGTDEIIADWMNAPAAKNALASADIIIHLSGDANAKNKAAYFEANYATTKLVADSARGGKCRRIVYLSYAGADADADADADKKNLYLRYKGEAEKLLLDTGKEVVIFRCPVIVDAPGRASRMDDLFLSKNGKAVTVIGDGRQKMRPLYRGDVVAIILAALERGRPGIYELSGAEEMTVDDFIRLANRDAGVKMRHIPGWVCMILSHFIPQLSPTFVDLMLRHTESAVDRETYREFGVEATSVRGLWGEAVAKGK